MHTCLENDCKTIVWKCVTMCNTGVVLVLSLTMSILGAVMWSVVDDRFQIAVNIDDVICIPCIKGFTISTLFVAIGSALTIFILICCYVTERHKFNLGLVITIFYTFAAIAAIVFVITELIWLSQQSESDVVQRFEESSKLSFRKQVTDDDIRKIWNDYQHRFQCCGVRDYQDYYIYFGHHYPISTSCCNITTLQYKAIECSAIVKNVTENDVFFDNIYGNGCLHMIINNLKLNLNSTVVNHVGIFAAACSGFVLVSLIAICIFTVIIIPENQDQRCCLLVSPLLVIWRIFGDSDDD